jgi:hypothetical protein
MIVLPNFRRTGKYRLQVCSPADGGAGACIGDRVGVAAGRQLAGGGQ